MRHGKLAPIGTSLALIGFGPFAVLSVHVCDMYVFHQWVWSSVHQQLKPRQAMSRKYTMCRPKQNDVYLCVCSEYIVCLEDSVIIFVVFAIVVHVISEVQLLPKLSIRLAGQDESVQPPARILPKFLGAHHSPWQFPFASSSAVLALVCSVDTVFRFWVCLKPSALPHLSDFGEP